MEAIFNRRSIRRYMDKKVEKEKIEKLLRAAMQAPSAGNQQPWEFIVVENKEKLKELSLSSPYSSFVKDAPLALILLTDYQKAKFPENCEMDMAAATENILLEAVYLGLGAVWIGIAPVEERINSVGKMFDLKRDIKPYCIISIGYPDNAGGNKFIDRFDEKRIHYEKY